MLYILGYKQISPHNKSNTFSKITGKLYINKSSKKNLAIKMY